ncbi:MAG: RNA polymerase sigma factor [Planctomycetota bacterium]|jgi:RNA polymerase sigma-70 factor (ECF subfamily)
MPEGRETEEDRLVAAARAGSQPAYTALVARYQRPLFRFLRMRTVSHDDAEEVLQESFLRGWTQLQRFDPAKSFSTWLYTIASRMAVSWGRRRSLPLADEEEMASLVDEAHPAILAQQGEEDRNLWDLVTQLLGEDPRSALWLAYGEGRSAREIGEILGMREGSVRVMLCRARKRLAAHLQEVQGVKA